MAGKKNNRRTVYTRNVIRESFLALLSEQDLQKITVTDITKKADINRGTFYQHYKDPLDLFHQIETELTAQILPTIKLQNTDNIVVWFSRFIDVLNANRVLSLTLLKSNNSSYLLDTIFSEVHDLAIEAFKDLYNEQNPILLEYYFSYFVKGTLGIIVEWLSNDDGTSSEDISLVLSKVLPTSK